MLPHGLRVENDVVAAGVPQLTGEAGRERLSYSSSSTKQISYGFPDGFEKCKYKNTNRAEL